MRGRFKSVKGNVINEVTLPVAWCPGAFQINTDGATLAKDDSFADLHTLLCREVKLGHIVRQELVSMIPAIFLDVSPAHDVLDMCAAPGSKTEQLLAALNDSPRAAGTPSGRQYRVMLCCLSSDIALTILMTQRVVPLAT